MLINALLSVMPPFMSVWHLVKIPAALEHHFSPEVKRTKGGIEEERLKITADHS